MKAFSFNMPFETLKTADGILSIKITGKPTVAEARRLQGAAMAVAEVFEQPRLLILLENFSGRDLDPKWAEAGFISQYDKRIEDIAIVGEERWRDQACAFMGRGCRSVAIEYFPISGESDARTWIESRDQARSEKNQPRPIER